VLAFEEEVLSRINAVRATGATCGGTAMPAVPALAMNEALRTSARGHSQDMAARGFFSHTTPDGRTFVDRIRAAGYGGSPIAENIAAGYSTPAAAMAGRMGSTGHCTAIMSGSYRVVGSGYAYQAGSPYGHYWTLNFGGN
jgi:uncharacterized protein YkwD